MPKRVEERFAVWTEGKEICWHDKLEEAEACAVGRATTPEPLYVFAVVSVITRRAVIDRVVP